ncbi:MAG: ATP-dependent DNA helicase DinG [Myxococcota bacterium]
MDSRILPDAADALREAIRRAGGVEVFAIGDVTDGAVTAITVTCRGQEDRVNALVDRPRAGQVVLHNHPSGDLRPSDADMQLAGIYGDDGVGFVIVDSTVHRSNWVIEPYVRRASPVDRDRLDRFFTVDLPRVLNTTERRPAQIAMAHRVADALEGERPLLVEAGTGTGKSLAYLVPAALWATANDAKVVVSTYTKALQAQLLGSDIPLLGRSGIEVRTAILQGRNNYLCKRRLGLAVSDPAHDDEAAALEGLRAWDGTTQEGTRSDLPLHVPPGTWERVLSDGDLTLRQRCPHYATCHYYQARRAAASAHVVVVNHALLLTDLSLKSDAGRGFLPKFSRLVIDEAHHLEDAATGAATRRLTALAVKRATGPVVSRGKRRGALGRLVRDQTGSRAALVDPAARETLRELATLAHAHVSGLAAFADSVLTGVHSTLLGAEPAPVRLTEARMATDEWSDDAAPRLAHLAREVEDAAGALQAVAQMFDDHRLPEDQTQPLLDVDRARGRLAGHAGLLRELLDGPDERVRWVERARSHKGDDTAAVAIAPVEVGPTLQRILWSTVPSAVGTSATLSVAGDFRWFRRRTGCPDADTEVFPSPFDHYRQAILGLPTDIPPPDSSGWLTAVCGVVVDAVRVSDGGAFVLCTSYAVVSRIAAALRHELPGWPVLAQGEAGRAILMTRFRENPRSVLVGVDSFWEGVSVAGDQLRLVIIPRLPFRVPTDPIQSARTERLQARGIDPFRAVALPTATIKLKQGYGRLIRTRSDRGAVLLLDRRVLDRRYGAVMLGALPPARRVKGTWSRVRQELMSVFAATSPAQEHTEPRDP